jgi:NitT/TauT family transport system substrate-binding protein
LVLAPALVSAEPTKEERPVINIGYQPYGPYWVFQLAKEKGWWDEAGVDVKLIQFMSGPPQNYAMGKGEVDVSIMGDTPILTSAVQKIYDPLVIATLVDISNMFRVIAQPEYNDIKELKHKKIGTMVGSVENYFLMLVLKKMGWTTDDVQIVHMETKEMQAAMLAGRVDACTVVPAVSFVLHGKGFNLLTDKGFLAEPPGKIIDAKLYNLIVARREWVEENPALATTFLSVMFRGVDYWLNNLDETNEWCRKKMNEALATEMTPDSFDWYWNSFDIVTLEDNALEYMNPDSPGSVHQNWINEAQFLAEHGTIPGVPDIQNLLDSQFVMSLYEEHK